MAWKTDDLHAVCHDGFTCDLGRNSNAGVKYYCCALHWHDDMLHDYVYRTEYETYENRGLGGKQCFAFFIYVRFCKI